MIIFMATFRDQTGRSPCIPPGMPRIYDKPKEISADTSTDTMDFLGLTVDTTDAAEASRGEKRIVTFTDDPHTSRGTKFPKLRCNTLPLPGMQGRAEVVGLPHAEVEWEESNKERRHDRVRCIIDGLSQGQRTGGPWTKAEAPMHINCQAARSRA